MSEKSIEKDVGKYSSVKAKHLYKGYDCIGDLYVVRTYIQKRYEIDLFTLEFFLKLMKMRVFTQGDVFEVSRRFTLKTWKQIFPHLKLVSRHRKTENRLYMLNSHNQNIIREFYKCLFGEKKIPETGKENPMANKNKQIPYDKKKLAMIKKINSIETPEYIRSLWED